MWTERKGGKETDLEDVSTEVLAVFDFECDFLSEL